MRGHVVVAFVAMSKQRIAVWHQPLEETVEVPADLRVGVLLHEQARRRMAHEKRQETVLHSASRGPLDDRPRDVGKAAATCLEHERRSELAEHPPRISKLSATYDRTRMPSGS